MIYEYRVPKSDPDSLASVMLVDPQRCTKSSLNM